MQLWKHPVAQFLAAALLALVLLVLGTGWLSQRAATRAAIADARATTELLARSVAEPDIPRGLVDGKVAAIDRFDRLVLQRLLVDEVLRIKIWSADGRIVYSDETRLIGERFALGKDEQQILTGGGSAAEVSDLTKQENRFEAESGRLLEVYTRVMSPEREPLLFEAYFSYDDVTQRRDEVLGEFRPITLGGLLLFVVLTTPLVWMLATRLGDSAREREHLLQAAADASDSERRRIARDLHDGVVQDLAGTSFALSAAARELDDRPELAAQIAELGGAVRKSLRALRSLLVEIYPPDLHTAGLAAAIDDLVAPAASAGVQVSVDVADMSGVEESVVALVWRVAQEGVRNSLRHGVPSELRVTVAVHDGVVALEVADDGVGFDRARPSPDGHFGLRGFRDLIREAGGTLEVNSLPGQGTTVLLEVSAR